MRIIVSGYIGKKITGIGRNLICLLDASSSDNEYIVYTNKDMEEEFRFNNPKVIIKTYSISKYDSLKNLLWTTFVFPFVAIKERADRVLIPNFTLLLFKFRPTVVIMHDLIEFNVKDKFSKKKMFYRTKLADPITAKNANRIITVSENSKKDLMHFLHVREEKIRVVYNGVDRERFCKMSQTQRDAILSERGWPKEYFLYAGTIDHPGKNAMSIVKVFENLKRKGKYHGSLVLAGMPGSGYEFVQDYINGSEYKRDIILTGFVTDEELCALYSACRVFCFVSLYEGFGIPPLEAMACGAKVVVSNTSSLPEVVGSIGWTVNPKSLDEIEAAVYEALNDMNPAYETQVDEHLKKYDWVVLSKKFEQALTGREKADLRNRC